MQLILERLMDIYIGIPLVYICRGISWLLKKRIAIVPNPVRKALFMKFWGLGNLAMILPVVQSFKERYPQAEVDFLTLRNNRDIARATGMFRNVYVVDNDFLRVIPSIVRRIFDLRKNDYDLIIDFEQFARISALLCWVCGKGVSVGFNTLHQHRHFLYSKAVVYNNDIHMTRSFHSLVEAVGVDPVSRIKPAPFLHDQADKRMVQDFLKGQGVVEKDILVLMQLGTSDNFIERRWPVEYYAKLADRLIEAFSVRIVFTGVGGERHLVERCMDRMKQNKRIVDSCGKLSFGQHVALWTLADLAVSADTASVHLASAMSVPAVGLYGPNTPILYGPWGEGGMSVYKGLSCSPCITNYNAKINVCRHAEGRGACMAKITVDEVFDLLDENYFREGAPHRLKKLLS